MEGYYGVVNGNLVKLPKSSGPDISGKSQCFIPCTARRTQFDFPSYNLVKTSSKKASKMSRVSSSQNPC